MARALNEKILVVDDEIISRRVIGHSLEKAGLKSVAVSHPDEALKLLEEQPFDLVFLDVEMPGMNGFELCKRLRAMPLHAKTPVIFVTALSGFESRAKSSLSGGDDFIGKPFSYIELAVKGLIYVLRGSIGAGRPAGPGRAPSAAVEAGPDGGFLAFMIAPTLPPTETARLDALRSLYILDTPPEERFDRITRLATELFGVPISFVSLVDEDRVWYKSKQGLEVNEMPRHLAFCSHAILDPDKALVISDATRDERFSRQSGGDGGTRTALLRQPAAPFAGRPRTRDFLHRRHREPRLQRSATDRPARHGQNGRG